MTQSFVKLVDQIMFWVNQLMGFSLFLLSSCNKGSFGKLGTILQLVCKWGSHQETSHLQPRTIHLDLWCRLARLDLWPDTSQALAGPNPAWASACLNSTFDTTLHILTSIPSSIVSTSHLGWVVSIFGKNESSQSLFCIACLDLCPNTSQASS